MSRNKWEVMEKWLALDWWRPSEACHIFAGLFETVLQDGETREEQINEEEYSGDILDLLIRVTEITEIWDRTPHSKYYYALVDQDGGPWSFTPEYCVKWALLKHIEIPWLDWAIEKNLIILTEKPATHKYELNADTSGRAFGEKKEKNILRLISILTERLVNPDMKSNFRSVAHLISEILEKHQPTEPPNSGLSKRTLDSLLAEARKVRPISESEPDQ